MKKLKLLSAVVAAGMVLTATAAGCKNKTTETPIDLSGAVERTDYTSVYEKIGSKVTIDMVTEDPDTGFAYATVNGVKYTLGMDFLSMAMVYNCKVPAGSAKYKTAEDVYNEWWKLYIQRWNYLMPEIPLYSNDYYDLYNAKFENFETTPYWGVADAIVGTSVKSGSANSAILGGTTDLSGAFRNAAWGKSSPGSSDLDIQNLTTGYSTIMTGKDGAYRWNMSALAEEPTNTVNEDGTLTYTIRIKQGNVFSDGTTQITAKNYLAALLSNSSPVGVAAGGTGNAGQTVVGYDAFKAYDGTNDNQAVLDKNGKETGVTASKWFEGVKLIDEYTFSVTYLADYADYYYLMIYAGFSPDVEALYLGSGAIVTKDDGTVGLNDEFYKKSGSDYANARTIADNLANNSASAFPYSGPYYVESYDASSLTATLKRNTHFNGGDAATGDTRGQSASIETISYIKVVSDTQFDQFQRGEVDVIAGITGGADTNNALTIVKNGNGKYAETHYGRAGYGKLGFRADYGPTGMVEVRQAIAYSINRNKFAQDFTGGFGKVVHGPYYEGSSAYVANKDTINLNTYNFSADSAIEVLEDAGWVYDKNGKEYKSGIRYKKLEGYEKSVDNLKFKSVDGKYKTVKVGDDYYMPLAINWYGTIPNSVTDQLVTDWLNGDALGRIGMYVQYISTDFNTGIYGELCRVAGYGYNGTPKLNAINFATGFTSAVYDYSFNWTIDPDIYDDMSICYLMDEADFWADYQSDNQ